MKTPDRSGWSQRTQRGIAASARAGFETRKATQRGSIGLARGERVALREHPRRPAQPADEPAQLALDDQLREVLVAERLRPGPAVVGRGREVAQDVVVEEVGERAVADVVEQAGDPEGLDDEPLGRDGAPGSTSASAVAQARVEVARPEARLVHHPEAVGEPAVLGRREDPAGALELADPAQPLEPGRVEEIVLGGGLVGQAERARTPPASSRLVSSM